MSAKLFKSSSAKLSSRRKILVTPTDSIKAYADSFSHVSKQTDETPKLSHCHEDQEDDGHYAENDNQNKTVRSWGQNCTQRYK